jgi:hypothetical protein
VAFIYQDVPSEDFPHNAEDFGNRSSLLKVKPVPGLPRLQTVVQTAKICPDYITALLQD